MAKQKAAKLQSQYKNVYYQKAYTKGKDAQPHYWKAEVSREGVKIVNKQFTFDDERGAARAVDLALIRNGYDPINGIFERVVIKGKDLKDAV
tara:strand:+ start:37 stop:312 length:276 start_codon:yes stop_codon:yes gene_type:complete